MKKASRLSAQKLRLLLIASIVAILALASVGFYFARTQLVDFAATVRQSTELAKTSDANISTLETLKTKLAQDKEIVDRAQQVVADSKSYAYQDQIIKDLNEYARQSGVTISGYTFGSTPGAAETTAPAAPATVPTTGGAAPVPAPAAAPKSTIVSVSVKSPVKYASMMKFLHLIEQNLTKMQLSGISLTKDETSPSDISVSALNVEVYTR